MFRLPCRMMLSVLLILETATFAISIPPNAVAQQDEMELIEQVESLVRQLQSDLINERDAAQTKMIELGPAALDYLEAPDDATTDLKNRIGAIRKALEKQAVAQVSQPSRVTLQGTMTVKQALEQIQQQTGNEIVVDVADAAEKNISLELDGVHFWEAIDQILMQADLEIDPYGGTAGVLKLAPRGQRVELGAVQRAIPVDRAKIFQIQVARVDSTINLIRPRLDGSVLTLLVRWEPRLRPISIDLPLRDVKITDEYGDSVPVADPDAVIYGAIQPELPELEFPLPIQRVDRQIEELQSLTATINAVLPGRVETFRFRKVNEQRPGRKIEKAGATVTFEGAEKNDDIYTVTVSLSFDEEHNALESHQGWVFENEIYLEDEDGEREDSVGLETIQQDNSKVTIRYLFLENPGARTLIYRTPAAIVHLPIEIAFKKIPLP